jgi:hypothetical protein
MSINSGKGQWVIVRENEPLSLCKAPQCNGAKFSFFPVGIGYRVFVDELGLDIGDRQLLTRQLLEVDFSIFCDRIETGDFLPIP